jgi:plasmid stabilization system protein ParE
MPSKPLRLKTQPLGSTTADTGYSNLSSALKDFPGMGRVSSRMAGWRELVFPPLPYIAVYRERQGFIEIARIFHGAQDWP